MTAAAIPHTHRVRHVTPLGGTLVCIDCGAELVLTCPNGHNPAAYVITDEALPSPATAPDPAPAAKETSERTTPAGDTGVCEVESCRAEFIHERRRGRRHRRCPECRANPWRFAARAPDPAT